MKPVTQRSEPIFNVPPVVLATIAGLLIVHAVRTLILTDAQDEWVLLTFAFIPAIIQAYLPSSWGNVPTLLFGLGAIEVARHPAGFLAENRKNILALYRRLRVPPAAPGELPQDLMVRTAK